MKVSISKIAVEENYISAQDYLFKRLVIYKDNNSALFIEIEDNISKEELASRLRFLANELDRPDI